MAATGKRQKTPKFADEPLSEQDEWVRNQLAKLWGEDEAEYFVNQDVDINEDKIPPHINNMKLKKKNYSGMFAHSIWSALRSEANMRLKTLDLNKELQNTMDAFLRNEIHNKSNKANKITRSDEELMRNVNLLDMSQLKKIKTLRNKIELMYRSSKLNEEKVCVLRTNSPLPDLNDRFGRDGISKYLPPIEQKEQKKLRINSALEFLHAPTMRERYKKKLAEKIYEHENQETYILTEKKNDPDSSSLVKIVFLTENSLLGPDFETSIVEENALAIDNKVKSENKELKYINEEDESKSASDYPPLTYNALMEYKGILKAPGDGDYKQGRPQMFKLPSE